jgi:hypothetical protein
VFSCAFCGDSGTIVYRIRLLAERERQAPIAAAVCEPVAAATTVNAARTVLYRQQIGTYLLAIPGVS